MSIRLTYPTLPYPNLFAAFLALQNQPCKSNVKTKVVGVVMMTSAILYGVERGLDDEEGTGAFNVESGWQWHDAFYFTIVTLSTVG